MKIKDIYNLMIKMGIESDFRGVAGVEKLLEQKKRKFENLSEKEKGWMSQVQEITAAQAIAKKR